MEEKELELINQIPNIDRYPKVNKGIQALIEQLNDTISTLENKLLKMDDSGMLDGSSKDKISDSIIIENEGILCVAGADSTIKLFKL